MKEPFWLVWSPTGSRPPQYRHATYNAAETEARRLAECWPGCMFFVLKTESVSAKQSVITHRLPSAYEIPF